MTDAKVAVIEQAITAGGNVHITCGIKDSQRGIRVRALVIQESSWLVGLKFNRKLKRKRNMTKKDSINIGLMVEVH
ncbi:MAG: hypothetical protein QG670_605 [Thermoproteota archaeon]|nr:hypothetical protein [Thermoproteota archaeon]